MRTTLAIQQVTLISLIVIIQYFRTFIVPSRHINCINTSTNQRSTYNFQVTLVQTLWLINLKCMNNFDIPTAQFNSLDFAGSKSHHNWLDSQKHLCAIMCMCMHQFKFSNEFSVAIQQVNQRLVMPFKIWFIHFCLCQR